MKIKWIINSIVALMAVLLTAPVAVADTWFVDDDQVFLGTAGDSWEHAFKFLQDALTAAQPGDTIRVAQGTYFPGDDDDLPSSTHTQDDQTASFIMKSDVTVFGGFKGLIDLLNADDRDIVLFETILSGDLANDDSPSMLELSTRADNSFSVVNGGTGTDQGTELDGFTIRGGHGGTSLPNVGRGGAGVIV